MSAAEHEYDVFLSFAGADQDIVRPLWQDLAVSGLRVFWSDSSLRERAGSSWFDVIQDALARSRHLVVVFTPSALSSEWVKREYVAFFNHCYRPPLRLLIPVLAPGVSPSDLPLFLRALQSCRLHGELPRELLHILGGIDVGSLKLEIGKLKEHVNALEAERNQLRTKMAQLEATLADNGRQVAAHEAAIRTEQNTLKAKLLEAQTEQAQRLEELERLRSDRDALRLRLTALERREGSYIVDDNPTGAAFDKDDARLRRMPSQFSRVRRGLYMFATGVVLNASLMFATVALYGDRLARWPINTKAMTVPVVASSVLWFFAGLLAPRRAPSFSLTITLAVLFVAGGR